MDLPGTNRYELLFMDDDISDPLDNKVVKNKKQAKNATSGVINKPAVTVVQPKSTNKQQNINNNIKPQGPKKTNNIEKENKSLILNKNENKKASGGGAAIDKQNKHQQGGASTINVSGVANTKPAGGAGSTKIIGATTTKVIGGTSTTKNFGGSVTPTTVVGVATNVVGGAVTGNRKRNGAASREIVNQGQGNSARTLKNTDVRDPRNNRRTVKENGFTTVSGVEYSSNQTRQIRTERERGLPRNRNLEGGNRNGKREFDRQSGSVKTGIKAVDKRDGAGAHNWGSVKEAIEDVNKNEAERNINGLEKPESLTEPIVDTAPIEEETKELTLDEWKAQKKQRVKPIYNIRKAGEGEDISQWKKMIVLNNNKKKDTESEEELEFDPAMYPQRVGRQQRVLDIQFNFNDGRRGGGGYGGRGRGRGPRPSNTSSTVSIGATNDKPTGRRGNGFEGNNRGIVGRGGVGRGASVRGAAGRGGKRSFIGDRQQNTAPKVYDERQFPTLA